MFSSPRPTQRGAVIAVFAVALLLIAAALLTRSCSRQAPPVTPVKSYMLKQPAVTVTIAGDTAETRQKPKKKRKKPARKHTTGTQRGKNAGHHAPPAQRKPLDEKL